MIPQRVKLKGFLCYKEEQEVVFDGHASLWMLSGVNGSGKSSIFDAITYALFAHHRGGSTNAIELINKESDGLLVEFDFLLDGRAYRAKRTYRRNARGGGAGTQQLLEYGPGPDGANGWQAIADTQLRDGFKAWVDENIGLNYETFTSSVVLLQGKAEKLLDSSPSGRHQVLAGIVGLEKYKALHEKAVEERKALETKLDVLNNRLSTLPEVTPIEAAEAAGLIEQAQQARDDARAEVDRLQTLELQARGWLDLQGRLGTARQRHADARRLVEDAGPIETAVGRLRDLREHLPRLHEIARYRGEVHEADKKTRALAEQKSRLTENARAREHALAQARDKRALFQNRINESETALREVEGNLRQSSVVMEKLRELDRQEGERNRLFDELARLPEDPTAILAQARQACERLSGLAQIVPVLARLNTRRQDLVAARCQEKAKAQALVQIEGRGRDLSAEVERLQPIRTAAAALLQDTLEKAATARTRLEQAQDGLQHVSQLDGAKVCRACGQRLTAGHVREEKARRGEEVRQAQAVHREAVDAVSRARIEDQKAEEGLTAAEKAKQEARLEYRDAQNRLKQARADAQRLLEECAAIHSELPEAYRVRATPAEDASAYPTSEDIDGLRAEAAGLTAARQRLHEAEQAQQQWARLKTLESTVVVAITRLRAEVPGEHAVLRERHTELEARESALDHELAALRAQLREAEQEVERLAREREQAQTQLGRHETLAREQDVIRQHAELGITTTLKLLPASWRAIGEKVGLATLNQLDQERTELEAAGTDEHGRQLQLARLNLDVLRQDEENLQSQEAEFPAEARRQPSVLAALLSAARQQDRAREDDLTAARQRLNQLENARRQRDEVEKDILKLDADHNTARTLAELLSRDRLQLHLVRQAERQVVEYANAVLDRLSAGQLYLKLSGEAAGDGNAAKALELEAFNRITGEKPINVAFLSGSQKFRVAVSLALGIGQYASRQHRPIEAVIIDEGFGCLDSQGRQVMIQELQNLRNQMRCILLVSHQEEFAEAFPDGFHFFLESGAARIRPFQK